MNIRKDSAGAPSQQDFLDLGFEIYETIEGNDMGQMGYSLPQFRKGNIAIRGGYWNYSVFNRSEEVFEGWWNSKQELEQTLKELL